MNSCKAVSQPGSSTISFSVKLPRWAGLESSNLRVIGRPVTLKIAQLLQKKITIGLGIETMFHRHKYAFKIVSSKIRKPDFQNFQNIVDRINNNLTRINNSLPCMEDTVYLEYTDDQNEEGDDGIEHIVLYLPPFSAFYSTNHLYMHILGFVDGEEKDVSVNAEGYEAAPETAYGYWNETPYTRIIHGERRDDILTFDHALTTFANEGEFLSPKILFQFEKLENIYQFFEGDEIDYETTEVAACIEQLLHRAHTFFNLKEPAFNIEVKYGSIQISNRITANANLNLILVFDNATSDAFSIERNIKSIFDLEVEKLITLDRGETHDPFFRKYPITMLALNSGDAISYIEDVGYSPIIGIIPEGTLRIISPGHLFKAENSELTLEFYDFESKKIVFRKNYSFTLIINFDPPKEAYKKVGNVLQATY